MTNTTGVKRPISPYLSVYKPEVTSIFSIIERVTGVVLVLVVFIGVIVLKLEGLLLSSYWYYSICYFIFKSSVSGFMIGGLLLFVILSGVYHTVFGVRYLYWDRATTLVTIAELNKSTPVLMAITVGLTVFIWFWLMS